VIPGQSDPSRSQLDRLVVSNILEWGLQPERQRLPEFTPPDRGERFPAEDAALAWSGDRKLVLTRYPVDELLAADLSAILGYQSLACQALTPAQPGNSICADLAADERTLAQVAELMDDSSADGPVTVESFGATPEYARLVAAIRKRARRAVIDLMTPEDHLDCARSLDSKVQAREYFQAARPQCPGLRLTRAAVVRSGPGLLQQVHDALQAFGPAIMKTEFGAGGNSMGVLKSSRRLKKVVGRILPDHYDGELLVEEFLGSPRDILSVSYNGMVQGDGKTYTLCAGRHFLHAGKFYLGSSLGVGAMPDDCAAKVRKAGEAIGETTAAAGYRGPLNVDFLYRESDGVLFPLEINPRRGLGGILADMCISLFGQGYEKAVSAVAVHSLPVSATITTYAQLRDRLLGKGFLGRESKGLVILPYSVSTLAARSEFGLAVFGTDGTSAEAALGEITGYLAPRPRRSR
jgi:hypothetical protein